MTGIVPEPEPESPLGPDTTSETTPGGETSTTAIPHFAASQIEHQTVLRIE